MSTAVAIGGRRAERAPDLFEPLLGYRYWRVSGNGGLRCLVSRERWTAGDNTAGCWRSDHRAPGRLCACGFNALHELPEPGFPHEYRHMVLGAIAAWGEIDVHRLGFRAEHARLIALACDGVPHPAARRRLERAAARYGVPVIAAELLSTVGRRCARPVDAAVLPGRAAARPTLRPRR